MEYAYSIGGANTPLKMKFQVNETLSNAGIVVLASGSGNAGVQISPTTSFANAKSASL